MTEALVAIATLFDFDGVLIDSEPVHLAAFNDVLGGRGLRIDPRTYAERYLSLDDAGVFRALLDTAENPLSKPSLDRLIEAKSARVMERLADTVHPYPGASELVARRSRRGFVGIVSGALRSEILFALERMKLIEIVEFIVSAESTLMSKPAPAPYRAALRELESRGHSGDVVAVEDSLGGIASAKSAGIRCVAVAHTYGVDSLEAAGADAVAIDLAGLSDSLIDGRS